MFRPSFDSIVRLYAARPSSQNLFRPWPVYKPGFIRLGVLAGCSSLLLAAGCSWVDSTGAQPEAPVFTLDQGNVLDLLENQPLYLDPRDNIDPDGKVVAWRWGDEPIEAGNLPGCAGINGFNAQFAAENLTQACVSGASCELYFQEDIIDGGDGEHAVFLLNPPVLKAPVGVTYQLFSTQADGFQSTSNFTFCLIAVNEAPEAVDDFFTIVEGAELRITIDGPNLLSNDVDDIDLSNQSLRIDPMPVRAPRFASDFVLNSNGTFVYVSQSGQTGADSFEYRVTDGQSSSTATATITVVSADVPPKFNGPVVLPPIVAGIETNFSLAPYFSDPEGSQLAFSASGLPRGLEVSPTGIVRGTVVAESSGLFVSVISVTDGVSTITINLDVDVQPNLLPLTRAIPDQEVAEGSTIALPIADYFSDPEDEALVFGLAVPIDLAIGIDRRSGVISGVTTAAGKYTLRVIASDGVNNAVAEEFELVVTPVPNRRPVYSGAIANQSIELGDPIARIDPDFEDPDSDVLTYTLVGAVPDGVVINATSGAVSGTPETAGIFRNISIRATDSARLSVSSDTFNIIVTVVVPNREPTYSGSLPNLSVNSGEAIEPFVGNFDDADGDELSYSINGTLPLGLSINVDGVITGIPTRAGRSGQLRIVATDPDGESAQSDNFRITVVDVVTTVNRAPLFSEIEDVDVEVGDAIMIDAEASDLDDDTLAYSIDGVAARYLEIGRSGEITGSIPIAGVYQLVVTVSDGAASTTIAVVITVAVPEPVANLDPSVSDIPNRAVTGRFSYDVSFVFDDADGDELSYTATNLPPGVTISAAGVISGASSAVNRAVHFIVVTATDGRGGSVVDGFRLTII